MTALDAKYAWRRPASRLAIKTELYRKLYNNQPLSKHVDEFVVLFDQLEYFGPNKGIREEHKVPTFLASLGTNSPINHAIAALLLQPEEELKWELVTADLITE